MVMLYHGLSKLAPLASESIQGSLLTNFVVFLISTIDVYVSFGIGIISLGIFCLFGVLLIKYAFTDYNNQDDRNCDECRNYKCPSNHINRINADSA
ncbi:hypothetical protein GF325_04695 [Candidatus Bathyarchaeota archaeon]|nr:hypothetical protein [Candidatus Bathyarchaeota archaeon]